MSPSIPTRSRLRGASALTAGLLGLALALSGATASQAAPGGTISGTVLKDASFGLGGVAVQITPVGGGGSIQVNTAGNGNYNSGTLTPGDYYVHFDTSVSNDDRYVSEWYDESFFSSGRATVTVGDGTNTDVDAILELGGSISGTVTGASGGAVVSVSAYRYDPVGDVWVYVGGDQTSGAGAYEIVALPTGDYRLSFSDSSGMEYATEYYNDAFSLLTGEDVAVTAGVATTSINATLTYAGPVQTTRIAGADRFATSAEASSFYASAETIFIANGLNYPDALSAAPAAGAYNAPLLLTAPTYLPAVVRAEIERLEPLQIIVVGGTGVVSAAVFNELQTLSPNVIRISGADRYATSRAVAEELFGSSQYAFVATGAGYADALAASAAAGKQNAPVILVPGSSSTVGAETLDLLDTLAVDFLYIAGGTGVVSSAIETELLNHAGIDLVQRMAGANRYETSYEINKIWFGSGSTVYLALGTGYADALAGGALAGAAEYPLFTVQQNCVPVDVLKWMYENGVRFATLLGGTGSLSTSVASLKSC